MAKTKQIIGIGFFVILLVIIGFLSKENVGSVRFLILSALGAVCALITYLLLSK